MNHDENNKMTVINIANDFSIYPYGRYKSHGDKSGEIFRDTVLLPAVQKFAKVQIILDGTRGYGSSFLEEAFGGLIRNLHTPKQAIINKLDFVSTEDPSLIEEIKEYMNSNI